MTQALLRSETHSIRRPGTTIATAPAGHLVPALIAACGEQAAWRYVDFFAANIRNPHTRRAYARACARFFAWCEDRGLRWTRKFGQEDKLGLLLRRTDLNDGQAEAVFGGFQGEGCS